MASTKHSWPVNPLSLEVRHESGKFVVSHPELNLHAEAETLDKAYRQITELIENTSRGANRQDMQWTMALTEFSSMSRLMLAWFGKHQLMWSLLVLTTKTAIVTVVSVAVMTLMGITAFSLVKPQIKASIKNHLGPAAIAKKVNSISAVDQMLYQQNLEVIVNFLLPFARSVQPLVAAAVQDPAQETHPENATPIDLAQPPKSRPGPE